MFGEKEKVQGEKTQKHYGVAKSYEEDRAYLYKRSEKRAWRVAGLFGFLFLLSLLGLYMLLPLKEVVPYVIRVDSSTGIPDVITAINEETLSSDEALDRYFVNNYVQVRESYTYQTVQHSYEITQLFSSPDVAKTYRDGFKLDQELKKGTATVKVFSISLERIGGENLATARIKVDYNDGRASWNKNYIVKLTYEYKPQVKLDLSSRIENPVGFFVTSYQVVQEAL